MMNKDTESNDIPNAALADTLLPALEPSGKAASPPRAAPASIDGPDLARYRRYVAHLPGSDSEKDAMIVAVWRIMARAVDAAWNHDRTTEFSLPGTNDSFRTQGEHAKLLPASDAIIDVIPLAMSAGETRSP